MSVPDEGQGAETTHDPLCFVADGTVGFSTICTCHRFQQARREGMLEAAEVARLIVGLERSGDAVAGDIYRTIVGNAKEKYGES